jgi:hypothetical protein
MSEAVAEVSVEMEVGAAAHHSPAAYSCCNAQHPQLDPQLLSTP